MVESDPDPRCPECGEPIGVTATYCMHCSADLTEEQAAADTDGDGTWDESEAPSLGDVVGEAIGGDDTGTASGSATGSASESASGSATVEDAGDQLLDPDGIVDNALTILVGIVGGLVAGLVGTVVLGIVTQSGAGVLFGVVAWLVVTAYLVRQRTVQGAISKSGYAVALVLLLVPLIALSPLVSIDGGASERGGLFVVLLVFVAVPAGISAVVGWVAGRFVPDESGESTPAADGEADAPIQ